MGICDRSTGAERKWQLTTKDSANENMKKSFAYLEERVVQDDLDPELGDGEDHNPEQRRMRIKNRLLTSET